MRDKKQWDQRYEQDNLPWDTGHPDSHLMRLVTSWPEFPAHVLEVGCGTGSNAVWLARQGFTVTGLDISSSAISMARERAVDKGVECRFEVADFLRYPAADTRFDFVFDRGCFHSTGGKDGRAQFVNQVASCLGKGGLWLSLMGNRDEVVEGEGPPRLSAAEIAGSVEDLFEILKLESCVVESRSPVPPRFWQCLMKVRES